MTKADNLKRAHKNATEYVGYIGRTQHHLNSVGKLSSLSVSTEINFQHDTGTTNYWKDAEFDKALALAIRGNFDMLAKQALEIMKNAADNALLEEKEALIDRLKEIERIEKENS